MTVSAHRVYTSRIPLTVFKIQHVPNQVKISTTKMALSPFCHQMPHIPSTIINHHMRFTLKSLDFHLMPKPKISYSFLMMCVRLFSFIFYF